MAGWADAVSRQPAVTRTVTESVVGGHQYALVGYTLAQTLQPGQRVSSDEFEVGGFVWRLDVYPGGYNERHKEDIGVTLELLGPPGISTPHARYEIALVDQSGRGEHLVANSSRDAPPLTVKRGRLARHASFVKRADLLQRPELSHNDTLLFLVTVEVIHSWTDVPLVPHHVGAALPGGGGGAPLALTVTTSASYPLNARPAAQPAASPQYVQYSGVVLPTQLFTYRQPAAAQQPYQRAAGLAAAAPAAAAAGGKAPVRHPDRLATYGGFPYFPSSHFDQLAEEIRQSQTAELAARLQGRPQAAPLQPPLPLYSMQHDAGLYSDPAWAAAGYPPPREGGYAGIRFDPYHPQQAQPYFPADAVAAAVHQQQQQQQQAREAQGYAAVQAGAPPLHPEGYAVLGGGFRPGAAGGGGAGGNAGAGLYSFGGELFAPMHGGPGLVPVYR